MEWYNAKIVKERNTPLGKKNLEIAGEKPSLSDTLAHFLSNREVVRVKHETIESWEPLPADELPEEEVTSVAFINVSTPNTIEAHISAARSDYHGDVISVSWYDKLQRQIGIFGFTVNEDRYQDKTMSIQQNVGIRDITNWRNKGGVVTPSLFELGQFDERIIEKVSTQLQTAHFDPEMTEKALGEIIRERNAVRVNNTKDR